MYTWNIEILDTESKGNDITTLELILHDCVLSHILTHLNYLESSRKNHLIQAFWYNGYNLCRLVVSFLFYRFTLILDDFLRKYLRII